MTSPTDVSIKQLTDSTTSPIDVSTKQLTDSLTNASDSQNALDILALSQTQPSISKQMNPVTLLHKTAILIHTQVFT